MRRADDVEWALSALGLGREEAQLYTILVERGPSTVGALAPVAGLSRTKAYHVLDGMVAGGLATLVSERPRTYAAADPDRMVRRRSEDLGSARRVVRSKLVPKFRAQHQLVRDASLTGLAVLRRAEEMLVRARRETVLVATFLPREMAIRLTDSLREVHARGVRVRTVVSEALMDDSRLRALRGFLDFRVTKTPRAGMLIVDDEEILIGSLGDGPAPDGDADRADGPEPDYGRIHGIWSRDSELIKLQRLVFEGLYGQGA
jgi:sugar-specific transcriptional regulator TrmB